MSTTSVELQLAHVITRLQQSHPELAEAEIRRIVAAAMHDLDKARLRQFVPLLVEKSAKAACRERCTSRPRSEPTDASMAPNDNDPAASTAHVHPGSMTGRLRGPSPSTWSPYRRVTRQSSHG